MNPKICPTCQAPIPPHAPGGFCPACLLRDAEEPPASGHTAPSLEEIAAAFPDLEIVRLIGQGGMGSVYQARQPDLDRDVALKILAPELSRDPAFAERFAREARALGKLNHPNIVTVFEHGEKSGYFYLLMEYVDGVNLRQAMRAGRFTPEQALAIVPGICDALQAAHAQGIWHRDIKPENILLDARGEVKIADFGIARMVGDPQRNFTLTMTGGALGSAAYMAPEQHETPRDVDHRADIYSLGVVIYEMLTGELPLGRFPAPSQRAAVNARIDEIVFRTLEKERELRQQSADEVKTEVQGAGSASREASAKPVVAEASYGKLALGLFLAGVLGFPVLSGFFGMNEVLVLSGPALLVAFALGVMTWREKLGKFVVIATAVLLVVSGGIVAMRIYHQEQRRNRAANETAIAKVKIGFTHPDALRGGHDFTLPLEESTSWFPRSGQLISLKGSPAVLTRARLMDVNSESVEVLVSCSSEGAKWETKGVRIGRDGMSEKIRFTNGTEAMITIMDNDRGPFFSKIPPAQPFPQPPKQPDDSVGNWKATLPDQGDGLPMLVELPGSPETKLLSWTKASGWMVHVGAVPVLLIAGEGTAPGYGGGVGGGKFDGEIRFKTSVLKVSMEGGDAVSVNGTVFDLTKGRVLLVHRGGRVKQTDRPLRHILDDPELDQLVGQLLLDDGYNYWTPELALASHIKAATQKALAVFECGVSTQLITQISKGGVDVTGAMRKWLGLSVRNVIRENKSGAGVRLVDEKTKDEFYAELIKFNDAWFIDSLEPVPITAADVNAPELAMEELLHAAARRDHGAMRARFSQSLNAKADEDGALPWAFEQLDRMRFVEAKRTGEDAAEVVVVETTDGSKRRFTFRMVLEDGAWKLTEHGL